jgi:hypothetical protein
MLFNTFTFVAFFLTVLLLYRMLPHRARADGPAGLGSPGYSP